MSLEKLESFVMESGNEEMVKAINGVKETYKGNVERLTFLEKEIANATSKRDSIRDLVKSKLGLDELSEDALDKAISKFNSSGDDTKNNEINKLSSMVEMLKAEKDGLESKYKQKINSFKIEKELTSLGAIEDTESMRAYEIVLDEIKKGSTYDDNGNLIFKANDGTTIRNNDGSPVTLADRYSQVKDSEDLAFLFKKKRSKAGSGLPTGNSAGTNLSLKDMNEAERTALFRSNPEQFKRLAGL